jgi:hypothetical protein
MKPDRRAACRFIFFIFLLFSFTGCVKDLPGLKPGDSYSGSESGLLIGSLRWEQGPKRSGAGGGLEIQEIGTGAIYRFTFQEADFFLPLPPGDYWLLRLFSPSGMVTRKIRIEVPSMLIRVARHHAFYLGSVVGTIPDSFPGGAVEIRISDEADRFDRDIHARFPAIERFEKGLFYQVNAISLGGE